MHTKGGKKILAMLTLLLAGTALTRAQEKIIYQVNQENGTISSLRIDGDKDAMEWLLRTDGSQYEWVGKRYGWGGGFLTENGTTHDWQYADGKYRAGNMEIEVTRMQETGGDLCETYLLTNRGNETARLSDIGIFVPLNDNYPDAATCMTGRCNVHIWAGGTAAYVNAMKMNGAGPNLGLMVTEGAVTDYEVWERGQKKGMSNFRGVFALNLPDLVLKPKQSYRLSWRIFTHNGKDFADAILKRNGMIVSSPRYVYEVGQTANVTFRTSGKVQTVKKQISNAGNTRITYNGTYADILGVSSERGLIDRRVKFILDHQQMNDPKDARYGAYMVYDNEGDSILTNDHGRSDLDEGRERVGMGILLAEYCRRHPSERLQESLTRYARFLREKLQDKNYKTTSSVSRKAKNRGYNYAWIADFYFRMYDLTGQKQYAMDGYQTLKALYRMFGHGFYCIDYPVTTALRSLKNAGMATERDTLLADFCRTADTFAQNGLHFPKSEVNYEQSIIGPAVQLLCEVYLETRSSKYLNVAQELMPALEALGGHQPSHYLNEIAIRHWDGYWFGKRQTYGDVYPHYWSTITAAAFYYYAQATGKTEYQQRAERIVEGNLSQFFEDGSATCAFVYPRRVNGVPARYADAYANDQDFALVFYLLVK